MSVRVELADGATAALECPGGHPGSSGHRDPAGKAGPGTVSAVGAESGCGLLTGPGDRRERVALHLPTPGEVLLREVDSHAADPVYMDVLNLFAGTNLEGGNA